MFLVVFVVFHARIEDERVLNRAFVDREELLDLCDGGINGLDLIVAHILAERVEVVQGRSDRKSVV